MEVSSKKRSASSMNTNNQCSNVMDQVKKRKTISSSKVNESPIAGTRIAEWEEYEKWKEVRGDIEPTMNYVEITPEAIEEIRKIKNIIGDYICQLCKVKYDNAFALAMHKCPRVVHVEFRCPECDKTFSCPANLASHRRWHKPQSSSNESTQLQKSIANEKSPINKSQQFLSRSDSRSTNTSSSNASDGIQESTYPSAGTSSSSPSSANLGKIKKDPIITNGVNHLIPDQFIRTMYNDGSQRILSPSFISSYFKQPLNIFNHRSIPSSVPLATSSTSYEFRRLQSSCIFCHEQFSELNHLLQHIRKSHAVSSNTNSNKLNLTLDRMIF